MIILGNEIIWYNDSKGTYKNMKELPKKHGLVKKILAGVFGQLV
jgi:hypothetical protein